VDRETKAYDLVRERLHDVGIPLENGARGMRDCHGSTLGDPSADRYEV